MRVATTKDLYAINEIMLRTNHEIQTTDIFVPDDITFISHHIEDKGFIVLTEHNNKLIAFLLVRVPEKDKDNLGYDLGLSDQELDHVAHIESVAVIPKHRGNKLQYKMIHFAERIIKQRGLRYSLATVSPQNNYSLVNFLKHGFHIKKMKKKYSGVQRLILQKEHKSRRKKR
jgi:ribosomal protein S18 acetylase RimI-like enzyme